MSFTFTEALAKQTTIMLNLARRLDEKGYALIVHGLNHDGSHNDFPYSYLLGGVDRFLHEWADSVSDDVPRANRKRPIIVHIFPRLKEYTSSNGWIECDVSPWRAGQMLSTSFVFSCKIPERVRYRPLNVALELMSGIKEGRSAKHTKGSGPLTAVRTFNHIEYQGDTKTQLEILIRMLEMPEHRKILRGE